MQQCSGQLLILDQLATQQTPLVHSTRPERNKSCDGRAFVCAVRSRSRTHCQRKPFSAPTASALVNGRRFASGHSFCVRTAQLAHGRCGPIELSVDMTSLGKLCADDNTHFPRAIAHLRANVVSRWRARLRAHRACDGRSGHAGSSRLRFGATRHWLACRARGAPSRCERWRTSGWLWAPTVGVSCELRA